MNTNTTKASHTPSLMPAEPELLTACKRALKALCPKDVEYLTTEEIHRMDIARDLLREAINKAEGSAT